MIGAYMGLLWLDLHDACRQDGQALFADMTARLQNHACRYNSIMLERDFHG